MNILEWLGTKAPGFNDLSNEERDAIMHFALLWSFFEAMALDNAASVRAITRLVQSWERNGQLDVDIFAESLAYFKERYFNNGTATEKFQGLRFRPHDKRALVEAVRIGICCGDYKETVSAYAGLATMDMASGRGFRADQRRNLLHLAGS